MKVGDPNDPGDLAGLKRLCGDYGLSRTAATTSPRNTNARDCGSDVLTCPISCESCIKCVDDCTIKQ